MLQSIMIIIYFSLYTQALFTSDHFPLLLLLYGHLDVGIYSISSIVDGTL